MALKKVSRNKINPVQMLRENRMTDRIEEEFQNEGVRTFSPNKELNINTDYLQLPMEITEVSSKELGEYLNAYTQQKMYMRTLIGWAECMLEEARRDYFDNSQSAYSKLAKTKLSETSKEREVNSDPIIKEYYNRYTECKSKLRLLNLNVQSIEDAIFLISREVSRRTGDFREEQREYNVSRR